MRLTRPALLLLSAFLISIPLAAQQQPRKDPQALAILAQCQAAMGASAGVRDTIAEGTIAFEGGSSGTITIKSKGVAQYRLDVTSNGKQVTNVFNGGTGHRQQDGKRTDLPVWVAQYQRPEHIPAFSRMADFALPNTNVAYVGLEDVGSRKAHHIWLWSLPTDGTPPEVEKLLSEFHVFIDAESLLVVKTQNYLFSPEIIENRIPVENYYWDYRTVGGVAVPFRMVRVVSGKKHSEIVVTHVALNVGVADSDFQ